MTHPHDRALEAAARDLPANVRKWVMRGGAVPDAVWFGDWSHLKRHNEDGYTWRRSEFCERLKQYLKQHPAPPAAQDPRP